MMMMSEEDLYSDYLDDSWTDKSLHIKINRPIIIIIVIIITTLGPKSFKLQ
jgi:hypothetical protein